MSANNDSTQTMTSVNEGSAQEGSSGIEIFFAGLCLGILFIIVAVIFALILSLSIAGAGAQSAMARQCFESGNLSSWQCGVFK